MTKIILISSIAALLLSCQQEKITVEPGMTKPVVIQMLGKPDRIGSIDDPVKLSIDTRLLKEKKANSLLIYQRKHRKALFVFLDKADKVIAVEQRGYAVYQ